MKKIIEERINPLGGKSWTLNIKSKIPFVRKLTSITLYDLSTDTILQKQIDGMLDKEVMDNGAFVDPAVVELNLFRYLKYFKEKKYFVIFFNPEKVEKLTKKGFWNITGGGLNHYNTFFAWKLNKWWKDDN